MKEIERIGKAGYIELPTKLNDNMVFGCDEDVYGHKWWFEFDDDNQKLVFARRIDALEKFVSVGSVFKLTEIFQDSFILQLYWSDNILLEMRDPYMIDKKITFVRTKMDFFQTNGNFVWTNVNFVRTNTHFAQLSRKHLTRLCNILPILPSISF